MTEQLRPGQIARAAVFLARWKISLAAFLSRVGLLLRLCLVIEMPQQGL
jgi:hypothetical protein